MEHHAHMAEVELDAFESAVTDWERFRCVERMQAGGSPQPEEARQT